MYSRHTLFVSPVVVMQPRDAASYRWPLPFTFPVKNALVWKVPFLWWRDRCDVLFAALPLFSFLPLPRMHTKNVWSGVCKGERESAVIKIGRIIHQSSNEWRVLPWETAVLIAFGVCLACHSCRNWLILVLLPWYWQLTLPLPPPPVDGTQGDKHFHRITGFIALFFLGWLHLFLLSLSPWLAFSVLSHCIFLRLSYFWLPLHYRVITTAKFVMSLPDINIPSVLALPTWW